MTEEKKIEEHVDRKVTEITGDDVPAGTDAPAPTPDAPSSPKEHSTENSTQNSQDAVEKTKDEE